MIFDFLQDVMKDTDDRKRCEEHNCRSFYNTWKSCYDVSGNNTASTVCIIPNGGDYCERIARLLIPDICAEFTVTGIYIDCKTYDIVTISYIDMNSEEWNDETVSGLNMIPDEKKEEYHKLCKDIVKSATFYPF